MSTAATNDRPDSHKPGQAREIFLAAVKVPDEGRRDEFLRHACGGDERLYRRVSDLLAAHFEDGSFLKPPLDPPPGPPPAPAESPGAVVGGGRYRLIEQIGEGGFGVVFLAEQLEPVRREVALKVLNAAISAASGLSYWNTRMASMKGTAAVTSPVAWS